MLRIQAYNWMLFFRKVNNFQYNLFKIDLETIKNMPREVVPESICLQVKNQIKARTARMIR